MLAIEFLRSWFRNTLSNLLMSPIGKIIVCSRAAMNHGLDETEGERLTERHSRTSAIYVAVAKEAHLGTESPFGRSVREKQHVGSHKVMESPLEKLE